MDAPAKKWFEGRRLLVATKHGKEAVIAPLFERTFGVQCIVPDDYDTDQFGTFTGEIPRRSDPLATARQKRYTAMLRYGFDLAIASEGSFGSHPVIGFLPCNDELLILADTRNNFEIGERELSTQTNIDAATVESEAELTDFTERCGFPMHGVILSIPGTATRTKGINDPDRLIQTFRSYKKIADEVKIETDMRAMHNPTRMRVIENAVVKLIERINCLCPECHFPGFGITQAIPGLPCAMCNRPTMSTLAYVHSCVQCHHTAELPTTERKHEDAAFCDHCNP
jgi:hypothetical protein